MKYIDGRIKFFTLLEKSKVSVRKHQAFRKIQKLEFISLDRALLALPETAPLPIVNVIHGDYFRNGKFWYHNVYCEIFWIGQKYHCWVGLTNTQYAKLPTYHWAHPAHT